MNKINKFYKKVLTDESLKNEIALILSGKEVTEATDEELVQIGKIAEKLGFNITIGEAKNYFTSDEAELSDDELEAVAGGDKGDHYETKVIVCQVGGSASPTE